MSSLCENEIGIYEISFVNNANSKLIMMLQNNKKYEIKNNYVSIELKQLNFELIIKAF